jgi:hypothetical protein
MSGGYVESLQNMEIGSVQGAKHGKICTLQPKHNLIISNSWDSPGESPLRHHTKNRSHTFLQPSSRKDFFFRVNSWSTLSKIIRFGQQLFTGQHTMRHSSRNLPAAVHEYMIATNIARCFSGKSSSGVKSLPLIVGPMLHHLVCFAVSSASRFRTDSILPVPLIDDSW